MIGSGGAPPPPTGGRSRSPCNSTAGRRPKLHPVTRREIHSWLMDMDGVLVREEHAIPGADRFIAALEQGSRSSS